MACSICFTPGHNEYCCPVVDILSPNEIKIAQELNATLDFPTEVEMRIARDLSQILDDSPTEVEMRIARDLSQILDDSPTEVEMRIARDLSQILEGIYANKLYFT